MALGKNTSAKRTDVNLVNINELLVGQSDNSHNQFLTHHQEIQKEVIKYGQ